MTPPKPPNTCAHAPPARSSRSQQGTPGPPFDRPEPPASLYSSFVSGSIRGRKRVRSQEGLSQRVSQGKKAPNARKERRPDLKTGSTATEFTSQHARPINSNQDRSRTKALLGCGKAHTTRGTTSGGPQASCELTHTPNQRGELTCYQGPTENEGAGRPVRSDPERPERYVAALNHERKRTGGGRECLCLGR